MLQVIVGSFLWGGPKMKNKKGEASEGIRDSEHQSVENPVTPTTAPSSQNLTPTSSVGGVWAGSRQMDMMRNAHIDIDLMRGWQVSFVSFKSNVHIFRCFKATPLIFWSSMTEKNQLILG